MVPTAGMEPQVWGLFSSSQPPSQACAWRPEPPLTAPRSPSPCSKGRISSLRGEPCAAT